MMSRYGASLGVALAITFGLLFIMQLMIASGHGENVSRDRPRWVDFVRVVRDYTPQTKREKPEKLVEPTEPPQAPSITSAGTGGVGLSVSMTAPATGDGMRAGTLDLGISDGEYLPLFKVMPNYPIRARESGMEGYAIVEYTVTTLGATRDIRLVESTHSVFDRSCIDAAAAFKYRPRYVNGEAIEVHGVRNRCVYRLDQ